MVFLNGNFLFLDKALVENQYYLLSSIFPRTKSNSNLLHFIHIIFIQPKYVESRSYRIFLHPTSNLKNRTQQTRIFWPASKQLVISFAASSVTNSPRNLLFDLLLFPQHLAFAQYLSDANIIY